MAVAHCTGANLCGTAVGIACPRAVANRAAISPYRTAAGTGRILTNPCRLAAGISRIAAILCRTGAGISGTGAIGLVIVRENVN